MDRLLTQWDCNCGVQFILHLWLFNPPDSAGLVTKHFIFSFLLREGSSTPKCVLSSSFDAYILTQVLCTGQNVVLLHCKWCSTITGSTLFSLNIFRWRKTVLCLRALYSIDLAYLLEYKMLVITILLRARISCNILNIGWITFDFVLLCFVSMVYHAFIFPYFIRKVRALSLNAILDM